VGDGSQLALLCLLRAISNGNKRDQHTTSLREQNHASFTSYFIHVTLKFQRFYDWRRVVQTTQTLSFALAYRKSPFLEPG
jgi:hypothetical protein